MIFHPLVKQLQEVKLSVQGKENVFGVSVADRMRMILERALPALDLPAVDMRKEVPAVAAMSKRSDLEIQLVVHGVHWKLLVETKSSGEPRNIREAAWSLQRALKNMPGRTYGVVAAPFLSTASQEILREGGFGWLDMAGNCCLSFDSIHIEIEKSAKNPFSTKRSQRSLFALKSARVLRILLANPGPWKVADLAARAGVSLGQVSKIRQALLEKEWATIARGAGMQVHHPDAVLDAWRDAARPPTIAMRGYTLAHGKGLDTQLTSLFEQAKCADAKIQLASYSVARRMAPFARVAGEFFYADPRGTELIEQHLQLEPAAKGENIRIYSPVDDMMWDEGIALPNDLRGTSVVQTYLDLWNSGDRGREAAEHFRHEIIEPVFKAPA